MYDNKKVGNFFDETCRLVLRIKIRRSSYVSHEKIITHTACTTASPDCMLDRKWIIIHAPNCHSNANPTPHIHANTAPYSIIAQ